MMDVTALFLVKCYKDVVRMSVTSYTVEVVVCISVYF